MENMLRRDLFVLAVASFNPGPSYYDVCYVRYMSHLSESKGSGRVLVDVNVRRRSVLVVVIINIGNVCVSICPNGL